MNSVNCFFESGFMTVSYSIKKKTSRDLGSLPDNANFKNL